jgi:hypothetical protein
MFRRMPKQRLNTTQSKLNANDRGLVYFLRQMFINDVHIPLLRNAKCFKKLVNFPFSILHDAWYNTTINMTQYGSLHSVWKQ